jgi:hypothetical protein
MWWIQPFRDSSCSSCHRADAGNCVLRRLCEGLLANFKRWRRFLGKTWRGVREDGLPCSLTGAMLSGCDTMSSATPLGWCSDLILASSFRLEFGAQRRHYNSQIRTLPPLGVINGAHRTGNLLEFKSWLMRQTENLNSDITESPAGGRRAGRNGLVDNSYWASYVY